MRLSLMQSAKLWDEVEWVGLQRGDGCIYWVAFSPDGHQVARRGDDGTVTVIEISDLAAEGAEAIEILLAALRDENPSVRWMAAEMLEKFKHTRLRFIADADQMEGRRGPEESSPIGQLTRSRVDTLRHYGFRPGWPATRSVHRACA